MNPSKKGTFYRFEDSTIACSCIRLCEQNSCYSNPWQPRCLSFPEGSSWLKASFLDTLLQDPERFLLCHLWKVKILKCKRNTLKIWRKKILVWLIRATYQLHKILGWKVNVVESWNTRWNTIQEQYLQICVWQALEFYLRVTVAKVSGIRIWVTFSKCPIIPWKIPVVVPLFLSERASEQEILRNAPSSKQLNRPSAHGREHLVFYHPLVRVDTR